MSEDAPSILSKFGMDPTQDELAAIDGVASASKWIVISQQLLEALYGVMGEFSLFREIVLIPQSAWNEAVSGLRVVLSAADGQPRSDRAPRQNCLSQMWMDRQGTR